MIIVQLYKSQCIIISLSSSAEPLQLCHERYHSFMYNVYNYWSLNSSMGNLSGGFSTHSKGGDAGSRRPLPIYPGNQKTLILTVHTQ